MKICDFGLARFNTGNAAQLESLTKLCGTFTYASPELYSGLPYTEKCDVFSTGIVLWELVVRVIKGNITEFFAYWKVNMSHPIPKNFPIFRWITKFSLMLQRRI